MLCDRAQYRKLLFPNTIVQSVQDFAIAPVALAELPLPGYH